MEIKLTDRQKIFLEGIVRSCAFLVVIKELSLFILKFITTTVAGFIIFCITLVSKSTPAQGNSSDMAAAYSLILIFFSYFLFNTYLIAKLCGIHKYFSQFKFWKSLIFLITISALAYYFCYLNLHTFRFNFEDNNTYAMESVATIIPSYLTYLFFNFLTKKFPTPFKQIGYFFSNQFYVDLFKKIQKKCKKD